jgi:hypothetical protein
MRFLKGGTASESKDSEMKDLQIYEKTANGDA